MTIEELANYALHGSKKERIFAFKEILNLKPSADIAYWCNKGLKSNDTEGRSEACVEILRELKKTD